MHAAELFMSVPSPHCIPGFITRNSDGEVVRDGIVVITPGVVGTPVVVLFVRIPCGESVVLSASAHRAKSRYLIPCSNKIYITYIL